MRIENEHSSAWVNIKQNRERETKTDFWLFDFWRLWLPYKLPPHDDDDEDTYTYRRIEIQFPRDWNKNKRTKTNEENTQSQFTACIQLFLPIQPSSPIQATSSFSHSFILYAKMNKMQKDFHSNPHTKKNIQLTKNIPHFYFIIPSLFVTHRHSIILYIYECVAL